MCEGMTAVSERDGELHAYISSTVGLCDINVAVGWFDLVRNNGPAFHGVIDIPPRTLPSHHR